MSTTTYLVGPPAVGKRTVGHVLSVATGAALIDNHLIADPIFAAYGVDGRSPLPPWIWDLVVQVRDATLAAVRRAPSSVSHIFTNYLTDDPAEEQFVQQLRDIAEERGALFVPVWLTCSEDELVRRVAQPDRAARLKLRDADGLRRLLRTKGLLRPPADALVLDTSGMEPQEAARRIVARQHELASARLT